MKYCNNCGKELADNAVFCSGCGTKYEAPQQPQAPQQPVYQQAPQQAAPAPVASNDSDSVGWVLLGFFLPGIAAILYFIWRKTKPVTCERMAFGVMISMLVGMVAAVIYFVIMIIALIAVGGSLGSMMYY